MTNEEAIKHVENMKKSIILFQPGSFVKDYKEALEMAIKALEQEHCEDAISRQYLIEKATSWDKHFTDSERYVSLTDIQNAPSVKQEPKTGRWVVTDDDLVYCSECEDSYYPRPIDASWYYCPHCGAKME